MILLRVFHQVEWAAMLTRHICGLGAANHQQHSTTSICTCFLVCYYSVRSLAGDRCRCARICWQLSQQEYARSPITCGEGLTKHESRNNNLYGTLLHHAMDQVLLALLIGSMKVCATMFREQDAAEQVVGTSFKLALGWWASQQPQSFCSQPLARWSKEPSSCKCNVCVDYGRRVVVNSRVSSEQPSFTRESRPANGYSSEDCYPFTSNSKKGLNHEQSVQTVICDIVPYLNVAKFELF